MSEQKELIDYLSSFITAERLAAIDRALLNRTRYITVVLEDIYYSQNANAVMRTCDFFGIQEVHIINAGGRYKKNRHVDLGTKQWLDINMTRDHGTIDRLRSEGYRIIATSPNEQSTTLDNFNTGKGKIALLLGNELNGLRESTLEQADETIGIRGCGFVDSLNISASCAIILSHLRSNLPENSGLTGPAQEELKLCWLRKNVRHGKKLEEEFERRRNKDNP
jgi:tRNA (guanosine-2'-O-)-methyltransferase